MSLCKHDPAVTYLEEFGWNVVRLPRADIRPLQLYGRDGDELVRLGDLSSLFMAGPTHGMPAVTENVTAASISGKRTGQLAIGAAMTILGRVISAMGGNIGIQAQYEEAKTAAFEFTDVLEDHVDILLLDRFLGEAEVDPHSVRGMQMLEEDEVHIVTAVIKSRRSRLRRRRQRE